MGIEQILIVLVVGALMFVNWLVTRASEARAQRRAEENPDVPAEPTAAPADPREEMRRLMESLGLPVEEAPVPASEEFFEPEAPPPLPVEVAVSPQPSRKRMPSAIPAVVARVEPALHFPASPEDLRRAVLLREILGPPKAFQG